MAYVTQLGNYVKFLRGTPTAWERLGAKDADTLYFISKDGEDKGKLYLGDKLIADGENITKIEDLENVFIESGLPSNSVLVYDINTEGWVPKTLQEIFALVVSVMTGATAEENGASGLVPKPEKGQQNLYLRGDATWANPTAAVELDIQKLNTDLTNATEQFVQEIKTLRGGYPDTSTIPQIAQSIVSVEIAKLVANAPEQFDTFKEIADWLQNHDNIATVTQLNDRVERVELAVFGPTDGSVNGLVQDMSDVKLALYGDADNNGIIVNVEALMTKVPSMEGKIVTLETKYTTMSTEIETIKDLLKWQDLVWQDDNTITA